MVRSYGTIRFRWGRGDVTDTAFFQVPSRLEVGEEEMMMIRVFTLAVVGSLSVIILD